MASKYFDYFQQGNLDTSWGLIYRLNKLFGDIDIYVSRGDLEAWNTRLDRVFANLLYKEELVIKKENGDDNGKIISVRLSDEDQEIYDYLNKEYRRAKLLYKNAKTRQQLVQAKEKLYHALFMKDVGLRKFMHNTLKLYLKEVDKNPARAMWGG